MKKILKIILLLIIIFTIYSFTLPIFSKSNDDMIVKKDVIDIFEKKTEKADVSDTTSEISQKAGKTIKLIRNITAILTVGIISFLGIKYMFGSVEEKAEYKKSFIPLIIGVFIVVSSTSIISALWNNQNSHEHKWICIDENRHQCSKCGTTSAHSWKTINSRTQCNICGAIKEDTLVLMPQ